MSNAKTHQILHEMFNSRDFDSMDDYMRPDLRYTDTPRGLGMTSLNEFKAWLTEWATAFSNACVADATYLDGGSFTVAKFRGQGTNDGVLGPLGPTGNRMDLPYCEILYWTPDGQVESAEIYYDRVTMLSQLGHMPPPE